MIFSVFSSGCHFVIRTVLFMLFLVDGIIWGHYGEHFLRNYFKFEPAFQQDVILFFSGQFIFCAAEPYSSFYLGRGHSWKYACEII